MCALPRLPEVGRALLVRCAAAVLGAGGGVLSKSESGADVADAIFALWKDPDRIAALGRAGADGVRAHYTVRHMADGVLKAYEEAGSQARLREHA